MSNMIKVGISDQNIAKAPDILVTYALGSCVGICLYDPQVKLAGLSHIMLPCSDLNGAGSALPYRFADTAIPLLLQKMEMAGARKARITAKIAGGAQMFAAVNNSSLSSIGDRNIVAVKECLRMLGIPIRADDTGKNFGRTLFLDAEDGTMRIKSAVQGEWVL